MSQIRALRAEYHQQICQTILGLWNGVPNNADRASVTSQDIAQRIIQFLPYPLCSSPPSEQTVGTLFEKAPAAFLQKAFGLLAHIRPGRWGFFVAEISRTIDQFEQYEHLNFLSRAVRQHPELAAILGSDYITKPDIVIGRYPSLLRTGHLVAPCPWLLPRRYRSLVQDVPEHLHPLLALPHGGKGRLIRGQSLRQGIVPSELCSFVVNKLRISAAQRTREELQ